MLKLKRLNMGPNILLRQNKKRVICLELYNLGDNLGLILFQFVFSEFH